MSCWEILGLSEDSDSRSIKRQYAALLKKHRPDEDPAGFQRLREAYEQAINWSRDEEPSVFDEPTKLPPEVAVPLTGPSMAEKLAMQLLKDVEPIGLASRFEQAKNSYCAVEFEQQLLHLSLSDSPRAIALAEWGIQNFHWLSPWLRDDGVALPQQQLKQLLSRMYQHHEEKLRRLLEARDVGAFSQAFVKLGKSEWLGPIERQGWLNAFVAQLLTESEFWSQELFETVCAQQGWKVPGTYGRCPEPEWSRLQARSHAHIFAVERRRLAGLDQPTPQCRAAQMMFGNLTLEQRQIMAHRFSEDDWNACRELSEKIINLHPLLRSEMPGGEPWFWRNWEGVSKPLPMYLPLLGMGAGWVIHDQQVRMIALSQSVGSAIFWMMVMALPMLLMLWLFRGIADRNLEQDAWLTRLISPRVSLRQPAPSLIRVLLPCWAMGLLIWAAFGLYPMIGYAAGLLALELLPHLPGKGLIKSWGDGMRRPVDLSTLLMKVMLASALLITLGALTYIDNQRVGRDQGLQPFVMRPCTGLKDTAPGCRFPATEAQWYGKQTNGQDAP
ncbi:hypothetical protein AUC61_14805 [Pseudomonas sp. S25]|uniref:J domain-containing protein n=1 Tax=Pseudomonas maioricensis TaxID=1766623 RepID=A0ABS9ZJP7_9PSED|nr:J domain-containing protein [Pseudomonas sp. S25]MCI8210805.1 hypothetical protein [Pseudomonas sp. S25]